MRQAFRSPAGAEQTPDFPGLFPQPAPPPAPPQLEGYSRGDRVWLADLHSPKDMMARRPATVIGVLPRRHELVLRTSDRAGGHIVTLNPITHHGLISRRSQQA